MPEPAENVSTEKPPVTPPSMWLLVLLAASAPLSMDAVLPSLPAITSALNTTTAGSQGVITAFAIGFSVGQLFWGPLSDRIGRRPVLLIGLTGFAASNLLIILVPSLAVMLTARLIGGVFACAGMVCSKALILDTVPGESRGKMISHMASAIFLAPALGPTLGGLLQTWLGWRGMFLFLLIMSGLMALYIALRFVETLQEKDPNALRPSRLAGNWRLLLGSRHFMLPTAVVMLMSAAMFSFITGSPYVLMKGAGLSPTVFGLVYMAVVVGFIGGAQVGARFAPAGRAKPLVIVALSIALLAGSSIVVLALVQPNDSFLQATWFVISGAFFYIALGVSMPLSMAAGLRNCEGMSGSASSLQGFLQTASGAAASGAMGLFGQEAALGIGFFMTAGAGVSFAMLIGTMDWQWKEMPNILRTYFMEREMR